MSMRAFFLCLSFVAASAVQAANWPDRPALRAVRAASSPAIDGDLSDAAWQAAPEFTDFTQHDPNDGEPATLPTSLRIVYDDEAIYFGAVMKDTHPPTTQLARRDSFTPTDFLSINLDPQHDRLSGNAFTVSPSNVQVDTILYNDIIEDGSWDGVWESATKIVPDGWIAEVRIPYSQLRFPDKPVHVWGINVTRRTVRNNEWVRIVNTRKGETGFVSHFADIEGLEGIRRGRPLELVPYAVGRSDLRTRFGDANPLLENNEQRVDGGLDVKYALTSSLTLTGTINPDFGQVEVDPAVVNLSEFETFYPEKRPFFTEGLNMFRFNDTPAPMHVNFFFTPSLFYTRRIGRSPQGSPNADYVAAPAETTILGAAKVTGKLANGWSIGVLDALTSTEHARYVDGSEFGRQQVEPMTNYFVTRAAREIGSGSRIGAMFTSVNRNLPDELSSLREAAMTGGVDGYTSFRKQAWIVEGSLVGSRVSGSESAIRLTQRSPTRYFQRPDAKHVELDANRTSLTGWGGRAMVSKREGMWRPNVQVHAYSPGYETNDVGFMQRTDIISSHALMQYVNQKPAGRFRERIGWAGVYQNRNFDGDTIGRGFFADGAVIFSNYWRAQAVTFITPGAFDDRLTRGGPIARTQREWSTEFSLTTDERKPFVFDVDAEVESGEDESYSRRLELEVTARPFTNLFLNVEWAFSRSRDAHAYVTAFNDPSATGTFGRRYVFGRLEQRAFEIGARADWTINPRLSFQLFLQPFIAAGDYHSFHSLATARTSDYTPHAGAVENPDFNFRSVRGSAVVRWEFRPGSALYVVWNENRADVEPIGDFRMRRDLRAIPNAPSHDVFLVKLSYWLPM